MAWMTSVALINSNGCICSSQFTCFANFSNGSNNVAISAAPADISAHQLLHISICGTTRLLEQGHCRHDLSRGAVTALVAIMLHECSLNRMKIARLTDTFDRCDLFPLVHRRKGQTGVDPAAINMHRASAALTVIAALLRSREVQGLTQ